MQTPDGTIDATRLGGSGQLMVQFATTRDVLNADGNYLGRTNQVIGLSTGAHTIVLGDPQDYSPPEQAVQIVTGQLETISFSRDGV